jgi:hypothetical protein
MLDFHNSVLVNSDGGGGKWPVVNAACINYYVP